MRTWSPSRLPDELHMESPSLVASGGDSCVWLVFGVMVLTLRTAFRCVVRHGANEHRQGSNHEPDNQAEGEERDTEVHFYHVGESVPRFDHHHDVMIAAGPAGTKRLLVRN